MKKIFSGIQPSGTMTLGNYIGAMQHFVKLQDEGDCYYCIVDYHAITIPKDPKELQRNIRSLAALYIAVGLDPKKMSLFVQSDVPAHTELGWIMNCQAHMGELERMTQFKDKSQGQVSIPAGLFVYPALQAADILLYQTTHVPVGEDQKQHLELTRDLAERFNHRYGDVFTVPEPMIAEQGSRIMSLDDASNKMSKSSPNAGSYISMLDEPKVIEKKFKRAVTDSGRDIYFDRQEKPEVSNLLTIFSLLTGESMDNVQDHFQGKGYGDLKLEIAQACIAAIQPIQEKYQHYYHSDELDQILRQGAEQAQQTSSVTMSRVRDALGVGRT